MAQVIYSNQVNEIKGSVGGLTFNKNKAGNMVRLKPSNRNNFTKVESMSKEFFTILTGFWNSLSADAKQTWTDELEGWTFVNRYDESKVRTGFNYFMSFNMGRLLLNLPLEDVPGSVIAPFAIQPFDLTVNSNQLSVSFQSTTINNEYYFMFYSSPPNRLSYLKQRTQYRLIQAQVPAGQLIFNLTLAYESAYSINWPLANETNAFKIAIAVCAYNWIHGIWSHFEFNLASFVQL